MTTTPPPAVAAAANLDEHGYLDLVRRVLEHGTRRPDRTGVGTVSLFGPQLRFDLRGDTLPLLTTKRMFWRGIVTELLWFIGGGTDATALSARGVRIWDAHGSRDFLDSRGFHGRRVGDLGPVYGFQWRHFGAEYVDARTDYRGQGVDQLRRVTRQLRETPHARDIVLTAWNPADLPRMVLPPCHCLAQFYVADGSVSCQLYQRSADMGLGVPFNVASYALLTHMLARAAGLHPGELIHTMGDCHVYLNHVDGLRSQLQRTPRPFPWLRIGRPALCDIDDFRPEDFELLGYEPHNALFLPLAV